MWRCQSARFFVNNNNKQCIQTNWCNNNDARVIKISLSLSLSVNKLKASAIVLSQNVNAAQLVLFSRKTSWC